MPERNIRLYLEDINVSGRAIFEYVQGMSFTEFCHDRKTFSAVIREFEIIGEAVAKLPDEIKEHHSEVQWQDIKDFRNILVHEYFGVDLEIVWNVIGEELHVLMDAINEINKNLDQP
jgi:uncharacterized protein with HEPN domain